MTNKDFFDNLLKNFKFTEKPEGRIKEMPVNYIDMEAPILNYDCGGAFGKDFTDRLREMVGAANATYTNESKWNISIARGVLFPLTYSYTKSKSTLDIHLIYCGHSARFRFYWKRLQKVKDGEGHKPLEYYNKCIDIFHQFGIDETKLMLKRKEGLAIVENGEIEGPNKRIPLGVEIGKHHTYKHVYHIDLNSAWPACACKEFPELRPAYEYMYEHRKEPQEDGLDFKGVMNISLGYFMSAHRPVLYRLAHIAKAAHNGCNKMLTDLTLKLGDAGFKVLLYNVDGIYYTSKDGTNRMYHDENEGSALGQWKHDYKDCKMRIKSSGAYELEENGVYIPKLCGTCRLDKVKPREEWRWGAIFKKKAKISGYCFREHRGKLFFSKYTDLGEIII